MHSSALHYVKNRKQFGIELLVAPTVDGNPVYHSYIIVHNDSPMKTFLNSKGRFLPLNPGSYRQALSDLSAEGHGIHTGKVFKVLLQP